MGLTSQNKRRRLQVNENKQKPVETVKVQETYETLKALDRSQQCKMCRELGLKGYTTCKEDVRIKMILDNQ